MLEQNSSQAFPPVPWHIFHILRDTFSCRKDISRDTERTIRPPSPPIVLTGTMQFPVIALLSFPLLAAATTSSLTARDGVFDCCNFTVGVCTLVLNVLRSVLNRSRPHAEVHNSYRKGDFSYSRCNGSHNSQCHWDRVHVFLSTSSGRSSMPRNEYIWLH